jgi:Carboxypeptidase regulatory-like domain/TonB dependent receptor
MLRTPEVCPAVFCPLYYISNILRLVHGYSPLPSVFCLLLSAFWLLPSAMGQSATATLSGTVLDQNGAVVAGVNIAVININIGDAFQRTTTTGDDGRFVVAALSPSTYIVKAERQGFNTAELRDVVLNVNDQRVITIHLSVGDISQTVLIEGSSLIDESPAVATTVDQQLVGNLPLNGRSLQSMMTLTPGVVLTQAGASNFNPEQGQFSVNGQRANTNYFTVDGVSANIAAPINVFSGQATGGSLPGVSAFGSTSNLVSVDAVQEFKVQTSTYAPEFGRTPGAQVSIVTRSGTNDFHGTFFEYLRNDKLDATDWFVNANPILRKPPERLNNFGAVLGGPILLPRFGEGGDQPWYHGRNRTFFFFSYEGMRLRQPFVIPTEVPSLAARQTAVARMQPLLNAFPLPTGPATAGNFAPAVASFSNPSTLNATSIRIDHIVKSRLSLFGRYNHAPSESSQRAIGNSLNTLTIFSLNTQTMTAGATWILSPTINNELRVNYSRNKAGNRFTLDDFGGAIVPPDSLLFPSFASREDSNFALNIFGGRLTILNVGQTIRNVQRQFNLIDNLSANIGSHQLKFGIDYRRMFPILSFATYALGGNFSSMNQAITGIAGSALAQAQAAPLFPVYTNLSVYGQDTWKVNRRLALTFGLRYEINPPAEESNGNHPATLTQVDDPATFAIAPSGTPLYKTTYNNFAPRFGLSYQLFQAPGRETVLRGGFGTFYDLGNGQVGNAFGGVYPYFAANFVLNAPFPLDPASAVPPSLPSPGIFNQIYAFDPDLKLPYTYQWNFAIEQSLGRHQTFSASYVAAIGRRLLRQEKIISSTVLSGINTNVFVIRNAATSDYHAMQLQFQRRLSRHLQILASYVWSHSIDIASNDSFQNTPAIRTDPRQDRGASDFDVRHAFNTAFTYDVPVWTKAALGKALLRNWSVDAIITARSATPVNVFYGSFNALFGNVNLRPDLVPGVPLYIIDSTVAGGKRINPAAFDRVTPAAQRRQGTLERNSLRGFSLFQTDFSVSRKFNLTDRFTIQFRGDAFNIFNHPNFANPQANLSTPQTFGRSITLLGRSLGSGGNQAGFNPLFQVGGPRSFQLSLKAQF